MNHRSTPKRSKPATARGQRTREKLLRAAEQVFGRRSYAHASIAEIARKAGVALGSFYVYFPDKQSIFIELVDALGTELRRELAKAAAGLDDRVQVEIAGLRAFFEFTAKHKQLYRIVREAEFVDGNTHSRYYQRLAKGYVAGLERAMEAGQIRKLDAEVLAYALMGVADFLGRRFVLWGEEKERERVLKAAAEMLRGLAPGKVVNLRAVKK